MQAVEDLDVFKLGLEIAVDIYNITKHFPRSELFCISSQMKRAAVSITSNLSEGASRIGTNVDRFNK